LYLIKNIGLSYLARISTDLGMPIAAEYAAKLSRLESKQPELLQKTSEATTAFQQNSKINDKKQGIMIEENWNEDVSHLLPE
jgi:hypothetical protein